MESSATLGSNPCSLPSCLSPEALDHFRIREQQVTQLDIDLEKKRQRAVYGVIQNAGDREELIASPQRTPANSFCAARASSAEAGPRQSTCSYKGADSEQTVEYGCDSSLGITGARRARTAGANRSPPFCGEKSLFEDAPAAAAVAPAAKKQTAEVVRLRDAISKESHVTGKHVGTTIREEYTTVFLQNQGAGDLSLGKADKDGTDAAAAALGAQRNRVVTLQQELAKCLEEVQSLEEELFACKGQKRRLENEKEQLMKEIDCLALQAERDKVSRAELCSKVECLEKTITELQTKNDQLNTSAQRKASELKKKEACLQRVTEEAAALRELLKDMKNKNNDASCSLQKEVEKLSTENKRLQGQRNELVLGFKKQMKLIDVLKKQKAHMEAARLLSFSEDEFLKVLRLDEKLGMI